VIFGKMASEDKNYVPRITQLDSVFLDREANNLVKSQLITAVRYTGQTWLTKFEPEIDAILRYTILRYTVERTKSSVGQQLLQIKYKDNISISHLKTYVLTLVFGRWFMQRAGDATLQVSGSQEVKDKFTKFLSAAELLYKILHVVNLLVFLREGKYPSLLERLFNLRQVSADPGKSRKLSYFYFTRELLWHGFAELLGFILPLINVQKFHAIVRKFLPNSSESPDDNDVEVKFGIKTTCAICNNSPVLPHNFGCKHLVCYYCIYSGYAAEPAFKCPLCGHELENKASIFPTKQIVT
ncbi:unnamed protein product, partial [Meganyctiphanes norvegica]